MVRVFKTAADIVPVLRQRRRNGLPASATLHAVYCSSFSSPQTTFREFYSTFSERLVFSGFLSPTKAKRKRLPRMRVEYFRPQGFSKMVDKVPSRSSSKEKSKDTSDSVDEPVSSTSRDCFVCSSAASTAVVFCFQKVFYWKGCLAVEVVG